MKIALLQDKIQNYITQQNEYFERLAKEKERAYLAFRDHTTDKFYIGSHDYKHSINDFHVTSSKQKASDYLVQNGQEKPELIETWSYIFRPTVSNIFEPENRFINQFNPSEYMKKASINPSAKHSTTY